MGEMFEFDANEMVQFAINKFCDDYGVYPNRVIVGSNLRKELEKLRIRWMSYESLEMERRMKMEGIGFVSAFQGIPVEIDYDNPDILKVGFMEEYKYPKND